jgi:hypothetical protein
MPEMAARLSFASPDSAENPQQMWVLQEALDVT